VRAGTIETADLNIDNDDDEVGVTSERYRDGRRGPRVHGSALRLN
jgi:hypothetical protein